VDILGFNPTTKRTELKGPTPLRPEELLPLSAALLGDLKSLSSPSTRVLPDTQKQTNKKGIMK
jgi:hypothetical protein